MAKNLDPIPTSSPSENTIPETIASETVILESVSPKPTDSEPDPSGLPDTPSPDTPQEQTPGVTAESPSFDDPKPSISGRVPRPLERFLAPDEEQAMRSLDDTVVRPLPEPVAIWEHVETERREREPEASPHKLGTWALVAAVAVVSFVAGGITARLSSQAPVLFPREEPVTEVAASYEEPTADEPEEPVRTTPPASEPEQDTSYDTTDDGSQQEFRNDETQDDSWQDQDEESDRDTTLTWDIDNTGDRSLSYDYESDRVTLDYDGTSMTLDLDSLLNGTTPDDGTSAEDEYRYIPDGNTGYDTEERRDWFEWTSPYGGTTQSPWGDGYRS